MAGTIGKRIERGGRRALRAVLRGVLPAPSDSPLVRDAVRRILVIRQDNRIGNLVMLTPLVEAARAAFPRATVDVLTSDAFPEVFAGNPAIARVIAAPKKAFIGHPLRFVRFFRALRRERYDLAFDASHMHEFSLSSAAAARMSGARVTVGYDRGDARAWLSRVVPLPPDGTHEMDIHVGLARAVAASDAPIGARGSLAPRWVVLADEARAAEARWRAWGVDARESIAIFLGGRGAKKWPAERFVEVADAAGARGRRAVFFGGPGEASDLDALRAQAGRVVAAPMPLRDFAATIAQVACVITADTGPMHVAVATGTPTVEIFTNSEPERYGYAHLPRHRVVGRKGIEVGVAEVVAALDQFLSDSPARRATP